MTAMGHSTWSGTWKEGVGTMSTDGPTLDGVAYTFASRFEGAAGASPEELLAVAHAGCFNQALANNLGMIGLEAGSVATSVLVETGLDQEGSPAITRLHVTTSARVNGASADQFAHCAERARARCSIAKVLRCVIGLTATLIVD